MIKKNKLLVTIIFTTFFFFFNSYSQNLITNGDFEDGGSGNGFISDYTFINSSSTNTNPKQYTIASNTKLLNGVFINGGDYTGGGNVLKVDGSRAPNIPFWSMGNTGEGICTLTPKQTYIFSYWVKYIANNISATKPETLPNISTKINGVIVSPIKGQTIVPATVFPSPNPNTNWYQVVFSFIAPDSGCASISLINSNLNEGGNDFAIDDLELKLCTAPPVPVAASPQLFCDKATVEDLVPNGAGIKWYNVATGGIALGSTVSLVSGNTYYVSRTEAGCESTTRSVLVTIGNPEIPTFKSIDPICFGDNLNALPTTSLNNINGTWSPAVNNTATTTYTFTPTQIPATNLIVNGSFSQGNTGFTSDYLFTTVNAGVKEYTVNSDPTAWNFRFPACQGNGGINNFLMVNGSETNNGNDNFWCQTVNVVPGKSYSLSYFYQTIVALSPGIVEVEINGVPVGRNTLPATVCDWTERSITWNSGLNTTARICFYDRNTDVEGNDLAIDDISFIPTTIDCAKKAELTIEVKKEIKPTFDPIAPICAGETFTLLSTSLNGINGTWTPAINNTTTETYTFIPNPGQKCVSAMLTKLTVEVNAEIKPTFDPIAPICAGETFTLPTTSLNGINGTWTPPINNTTTETYTFTPNLGQKCVSAMLTKLTIEVSAEIKPTFNPIGPICAGETFTLPTTSLNGINGTWTPAINNTMTVTYTFIPNPGQKCVSAILTELEVKVNDRIIPTFDPIAPICAGETFTLTATSLNGINGTWTPAINNTATTTYTFTPDKGQCASPDIKLEVVVKDIIYPDFDISVEICAGDTPPILENTSPNGIEGTWFPTIINNTSDGVYTFTPNPNQCAEIQEVFITIKQPTLKSVECIVGESFSGNRDIVVKVTEPGLYLYQLDAEIAQENNEFYNVKPGIHLVTVSDINICSDPITKEVLVLDYPKYFTPNSDGFHDTWNILGLEEQPEAKIYIFDRYGKLIKQISPTGKGWDGTFNGKLMPSSDYWFTVGYNNLNLSNSNNIFKAHFALKR
jgi:gliding motility-associated-like protein